MSQGWQEHIVGGEDGEHARTATGRHGSPYSVTTSASRRPYDSLVFSPSDSSHGSKASKDRYSSNNTRGSTSPLYSLSSPGCPGAALSPLHRHVIGSNDVDRSTDDTETSSVYCRRLIMSRSSCSSPGGQAAGGPFVPPPPAGSAEGEDAPSPSWRRLVMSSSSCSSSGEQVAGAFLSSPPARSADEGEEASSSSWRRLVMSSSSSSSSEEQASGAFFPSSPAAASSSSSSIPSGIHRPGFDCRAWVASLLNLSPGRKEAATVGEVQGGDTKGGEEEKEREKAQSEAVTLFMDMLDNMKRDLCDQAQREVKRLVEEQATTVRACSEAVILLGEEMVQLRKSKTRSKCRNQKLRRLVDLLRADRDRIAMDRDRLAEELAETKAVLRVQEAASNRRSNEEHRRHDVEGESAAERSKKAARVQAFVAANLARRGLQAPPPTPSAPGTVLAPPPTPVGSVGSDQGGKDACRSDSPQPRLGSPPSTDTRSATPPSPLTMPAQATQGQATAPSDVNDVSFPPQGITVRIIPGCGASAKPSCTRPRAELPMPRAEASARVVRASTLPVAGSARPVGVSGVCPASQVAVPSRDNIVNARRVPVGRPTGRATAEGRNRNAPQFDRAENANTSPPMPRMARSTASKDGARLRVGASGGKSSWRDVPVDCQRWQEHTAAHSRHATAPIVGASGTGSRRRTDESRARVEDRHDGGHARVRIGGRVPAGGRDPSTVGRKVGNVRPSATGRRAPSGVVASSWRDGVRAPVIQHTEGRRAASSSSSRRPTGNERKGGSVRVGDGARGISSRKTATRKAWK